MQDKIMQNLRETLLLFGSFPGMECMEKDGGIFYCSHIPSAGENYLLLPENETNPSSTLREGFAFFQEHGTPFICPIPANKEAKIAPLLEKSGMRERARLTGMVRNLREYESGAGETASLNHSEDPERLASALWRAFDSDDAPPKPFVSFVQWTLAADQVKLYALQEGREIAALAMLTQTHGSAGIYYVATLPDFRRRGLGQILMHQVLSNAKAMGYEYACLLATAQGHPLYLKCGFEDVFSSGVYSHAEEL